jgi:transcriptional regulator with XRE-family HTH domain
VLLHYCFVSASAIISIMKTPMPVISPYLERLWNRVLLEKGWNAKQLANESGISYGYVRKIVNGTIIPSRNALRRMCAATGQDFISVWSALHAEHLREEPYEVGLNIGAAAIRGEDLDSPDAPVSEAIRKRMLELFDKLTLEGRLQLLKDALASNKMYRALANGPEYERPAGKPLAESDD